MIHLTCINLIMERGSEVYSQIGMCVRNADGFVLERNQVAISTCGQFCDQICMREIRSVMQEGLENKKAGFHLYPKIKTTEAKIADMVVAVVGPRVMTFVYPLDVQIEQDLAKYKDFKLTVSETRILGQLLVGKNNQDIADKLFISRATLKKHLNNIYKKIPKEMRPR